MAGANLVKEVKLNQLNQSVVASQTAQAVSNDFGINGFSRGLLRVDINASALTAGSGISAILQNKDGSQADWVTVKTVAMTATGVTSININQNNSADFTAVPLRPLGRVVITTLSGASLTIDSILVFQEE